MELTRVNQSHAKRIFEIMKHNAKEYGKSQPFKYWVDFTKYSELNPDDQSWVCVKDGRVVGVIWFTKKLFTKALLDEYDPNALVLSIYTDSKNKGIGSFMLDEAMKLLGNKKIYASTYSTNTTAQRFFERNGFVLKGEGPVSSTDHRTVKIYLK